MYLSNSYPLPLFSSTFSHTTDDFIDDNCSFLSYDDRNNSIPSSLSVIYPGENNYLMTDLMINLFNEKDAEKKPIFKTELIKKKRGRKLTTNNKKEHTPYYDDNILSKIQTHFLNFSVSLINECIKNCKLNRRLFIKNFNRANKSKVTRDYFNQLKSLSIKELVKKMGVSDKYKKYGKDINKKNLEKLSKDIRFEKLFEIKYLDLFKNYYNDEKPLEEFPFFGMMIKLSGKTKSFYWLIKNNKHLKEYLIKAIKTFYFNNKSIVYSE